MTTQTDNRWRTRSSSDWLRPRAGLLLAVVLTMGLASPGASAHGGDATKLHGCISTFDGSLRIIGAADVCDPDPTLETPLDWTGNAATATGNQSTVAGGVNNLASGVGSAVGGGTGNTASGVGGVMNNTVAGGVSNTATGHMAAIGGGQSNTASNGTATVGGGRFNTASGVIQPSPAARAIRPRLGQRPLPAATVT